MWGEKPASLPRGGKSDNVEIWHIFSESLSREIFILLFSDMKTVHMKDDRNNSEKVGKKPERNSNSGFFLAAELTNSCVKWV